ncbi:glycoside hydrolase family 114 protein [Cylindrobasidium torrendii FP15055 ss-10]|uniref:alpha-galactosidase n=1 Tax=Cylindrobasidium torrendii FP15055 ss-10 TaxID=1314674 RepID=A0A0D7BFU6_9AGAR|nr:glycoside hydrolase family 114 protein [Cylindrobasidium torrendii FP15055 ss-10]
MGYATSLTLLVALAVSTTVSASPTARAVTLPPVNGKADYQLGGAYTPANDVVVVTRDSTASPVSGKYNICYINAFQTQPGDKAYWEDSARSDLLLRKSNGDLFEDPDWKGEYFLDTSTDAKRQRLATIINGWIDGCNSKGFDAIEPDNLDTFTRSNDLLTADNNLALAKLFTDHAHTLGLAVAQKNTGGELEGDGKEVAGFDFAVAEECQEYQQYGECDAYANAYGNNWIEIEYTDNGVKWWNQACTARGASISVIYRDREVVPSSSSDYHYQEC